MGFSYRKSMKVGPVRVTASKSGISYSAGVKGARVTKRADGRVQTTLSAPGTGARYTATSGRPNARVTPANGMPYVVIADGYAWTGEPAKFKGFGFRRVTLHSDHVEIKRLGHRFAIPAQDIIEVRAGAPMITAHGYLWFATEGDPVALSQYGQGSHGVTSNRQVIMFNAWRPSHRRTFRHLCGLLRPRDAV